MWALWSNSGTHKPPSAKPKEKLFKVFFNCICQGWWQFKLQAHELEVQMWEPHFQPLNPIVSQSSSFIYNQGYHQFVNSVHDYHTLLSDSFFFFFRSLDSSFLLFSSLWETSFHLIYFVLNYIIAPWCYPFFIFIPF